MWVGRTTAAVIGLAIALAVVFGVATMALAAVPGDPFKLGKVNSIDRMSTLVGTATSPMLKVENKGSGTALNLKAQQGKPLLTGTSTGRVPNLNSDKLDGVEARQFQRTVAQPGQVFSGQLAVRYVPGSFWTLAEPSYPVPLPAGKPTPTLEYVPGAPTATCPGIGKATAGKLCVYAYNKANISNVEDIGNPGEAPKLCGFALEVYPTTSTVDGWILANWTYKVP